MFLHVLFILSKQPPAEPGYSGCSKDQKRTMESESPVVLSICGDSWYRLHYWIVSWRSIDETRLEMCLSQRSLVRGVPHRRGGTPFGAFQPEIWGISFFLLCSVFICFKSQCLDHLSHEFENENFRKWMWEALWSDGFSHTIDSKSVCETGHENSGDHWV